MVTNVSRHLAVIFYLMNKRVGIQFMHCCLSVVGMLLVRIYGSFLAPYICK